MYRRSVIKRIPVEQEVYVIPVNVIAGFPQIQDFYCHIENLMIGYYFILHTNIMICPETDYLLLGRGLEGPE